MNPILTQLQNGQQNPLANLYSLYKAGADPRELVKGNPMLSQIVNCGDLKTTFYKLCEQRGVNPDSILNQFK